MSFTFDVNNANGANGGAEAIFDLKALLKAAGWVVRSSGDATTYFSSSDGITTAGTGAGGMNNSRSWFCIRAPASMTPRREFCFQRGTTGNTHWWIKVSAEDGFTGGTPDADDMPTATDEQNLHGTAVAGTSLFTTAATYRHHIGADNATPFGWYIFNLVNGTGVQDAAIVFDPLATGSYPSQDDDPALYLARQGSPFNSTGLGSTTTCPLGWYQKDLGGEAWVRFPALTYNEGSGASQTVPNLGTNPYTSADDHFPIPYARRSGLGTQVGWKGFGTVIRWLSTTRANGDTLSTSGVKDHIIVGNCILPWPDVVPVI